MTPVRIPLLRLCAALLLVWAVSSNASAVAEVVTDLPAAQLSDGIDLLAVPSVDLEGSEPEVRAALEGARHDVIQLRNAGERDVQRLAEAYGELGALYHVHHVFVPAEACYRNAQRLVPRDHRWPYYLGYFFQQNSQLQQAAASFEQALQLRPDDPQTQLRLAMVYLELNELARAAGLLRQPLELPALRGAAAYQLGRVNLRRHDYQEAVRVLQLALQASPDARRIHYSLALAYRGLGSTELAQQHLALYGKGEPSFADPLVDELKSLLTGGRTYQQRAVRAIKARHFDEAAAAFAKVVALSPDNVNARVSWARTLYLTGDQTAAREQLDAALRRQPQHELANFLVAVLEDGAGNAANAISGYRATLTSNPDHAGAHYYLANRLMEQGDFGAAAEHFGRAVEQTPGNLPAHLLGAVCLLRGGRGAQTARDRLEDALAIHPDNSVLSYALARLLAAADDPSVRDSARALTMARWLLGERAIVEHMEVLAMAHAALGQFDQALETQREALGWAAAMGRGDLFGRLNDNLARYEQGLGALDPWPSQDQVFNPYPVDVSGPFRDYPTIAAY